MIRNCKYIQVNDEIRNITKNDMDNIRLINYQMANKALRVLAVAIKRNLDKEEAETDLIFVGLWA